MVKSLTKIRRVREELTESGVTHYGLTKSESKALPDYLAENEHILASIYGQFEASSAMMVATNQRVLFVNVRAFNVVTEETGYDMVGDISVDDGIFFSSIELRTRPRDYKFTMVNKRCARRFLNVIERMSIDQGLELNVEKPKALAKADKQYVLPASTSEEIEFLHKHNRATLSSRGEEGYPYGATVFYFYDKLHPDHVYIASKTTTPTAQNILRNSKVGLTITDFKKLLTMHIAGDAVVEIDNKQKNTILGLLFTHGARLSGGTSAPATQIKEGDLAVYCIGIKTVYMHAYK